MMKNYGLIIPTIDESQDYILGAARAAPFEITNESGNWSNSLPVEEPQARAIETNSCTDFGTLNLIEILLRYLFNVDKNYSERFTAIVSEQTEFGNDPHKVLESIRNFGVLEELLLPFTDSIKSFTEYFTPKPMTDGFLAEAKKFLSLYDFKHEYLFRQSDSIETKQKALLQGLKRSPVGVSVYAWQMGPTGIYMKPRGAKDNHWCVLIDSKEGEWWKVFDSYDGFIKMLEWNFDFSVAKGVSLKKKAPEQVTTKQSFWQWLKELFLNILFKS